MNTRSAWEPWEPWNFRDQEAVAQAKDLTGFKVHAADGDIGKVDEASMEVGAGHIVVDTGPWIFGRKVMLPAACVERIDWQEESIYVDRTKDEIKGSPELGADSSWSDPGYRDDLSTYYGGMYLPR